MKYRVWVGPDFLWISMSLDLNPIFAFYGLLLEKNHVSVIYWGDEYGTCCVYFHFYWLFSSSVNPCVFFFTQHKMNKIYSAKLCLAESTFLFFQWKASSFLDRQVKLQFLWGLYIFIGWEKNFRISGNQKSHMCKNHLVPIVWAIFISVWNHPIHTKFSSSFIIVV